jgi:hypothetical protein
MMTKKHADELATAMLSRIPLVEASADDPRVLAGELILVKQAHRDVVRELQRFFKDVRQALNKAAKKCEGRGRDEIAEFLGAALNRVAPLKPL